MLLLIDNYDSFTYNLVHFLGELGADAEVRRNDALSVDEALAMQPDCIVLSPGPCDPDRAGICVALSEQAGKAGIPVLGVCLGHQAMAQAFGARIVRAPSPMHGKRSEVSHTGAGVFSGLPNPLIATRYHSLTVARETLPDCWDITAETDDGIIMGIAHRQFPLHGVQFHPESIATESGHALLDNFLALSRGRKHAA